MRDEFLAIACKIYHALAGRTEPLTVAGIAVAIGMAEGESAVPGALLQHLHNICGDMFDLRAVIGFRIGSLAPDGGCRCLMASLSTWMTWDDYLKRESGQCR